METPKSARQHLGGMRNHTPRLSERKKKLFGTVKDNECGVDDEDEMLKGIEPLTVSRTRNSNKTPKSTKTVEALMGSCKKSPRVISFFETESEDGDTGEEQKPSPSRRSVRLSMKKSLNNRKSDAELSTSPHKENIPVKTPTHKEIQETKQLQKMFNNSMQITPREKSMVIEETSSEEEDLKEKRNPTKKSIPKRHCETESSTSLSPMRKLARPSISPIGEVSISTKSFYSGKNKVSTPSNLGRSSSCRNLFGHSLGNLCETPTSRYKQGNRRSLSSTSTSINRGVHHKIRKRPNALGLATRHLAPVDIDHILNNVRNEKLRNLITAKREEKQQIEKVHSIFRRASNPIAMARPLSSLSNNDDVPSTSSLSQAQKQQDKPSKSSQTTGRPDNDFSDIECDDEVDDDSGDNDLEKAIMAMNEDVIPTISNQADDTMSVKSEDQNSTKRKFFKSGRTTSTRKEVHLTDNIKAIVTAGGKLAIVPEKKKVKKRIKLRNSVTNEFSDEQATVDAILRNLDDTAFGDMLVVPREENENQNLNIENNDDNSEFFDEIDQQLALMNAEESSPLLDDIILQDNQDFAEFRKRLPYNTTDPEIIERQHLLLDFLISNNICTEENFTIFIADPDNHKEEAERIVDELVMVVTDHQNTDFRQRIPYNTTDPEIIAQQHSFLDFLLENNICTEENFDIFIANYNQRKAEADAILTQYVTTVPAAPEMAHVMSDVINPVVDKTNMYLSTNSNSQLVNVYDSNNPQPQPITPEQILPTTVPPIPSSTTVANNTNVPLNNCEPAGAEALSNVSQQQKYFPMFYPGGCQPLVLPTTRRKQQRLWNAGYGTNQYQIDAGQKAFGAHQCKQCGLVYTLHEPEEEKLHRDFHASLHILRFKGWIDEDIVAIYPEWGPDGRIIRLTESSNIKRRERLMDTLKIIDKELGFSSYIIPKTFVAYFAVRKMQIVGLCLVQPLDKAYKYICVNGVDCCTEEQYEAKCGISRIWVSPLHRRLHIGSKLIQAVQLNTIFGEEVPLEKIAFSAPTEMGKAFAQKITKTENFLVYQ